MKTWRLLNTGFRTGAENMAIDHALLSCRDKGSSPNSLRYMFFRNDIVLLGYHQCAELEADIEYCQQNNIEITRRLTGGGAIFMQPCQIGFELICDADQFLSGLNRKHLYKVFSEPVVNTLKKLGLDAVYRPLNDIEIKGKKVSGTGGVDGKHSFLFHGSLLLDIDLDKMIKSLRIPIEKISDKAINSIQERLTTLNHELGKPVEIDEMLKLMTQEFSESLGVEFDEQPLNAAEETILNDVLEYYQSNEWINKVRMPKSARKVLPGIHKSPGGLIRVVLVIDKRNRQIQSVMITGDFMTSEPRLLRNMEAALKGITVHPGHIRWIIHNIMRDKESAIPNVTAEDFTQAILQAIQKQSDE